MSSPALALNSLLDRGFFSQTPDKSPFTALNPEAGRLSDNGNLQQSGGFEVFNAILQRAYQNLAAPLQIGEYELDNPQIEGTISSQQAADTVLNFITQRIQADAAGGASEDELLTRLEQGLNGFIQGFNEAKEQIEALGLLTPTLSEEINDTYERVTNGISQLRESIIGEAGTEDSNADNNEITNTGLIDDLNASGINRLRLASQSSESSSFSLSLTTQDGDQVTIDISRASQSSFNAAFDRNGSSSSLSVNQQSSSSSSFSLNVTGELDEDELTAINQLLQDVDAIATDFFNGQYEEAFALALELDIDREELSGLNLQLQKTTTRRALASYQSTAQNDLPSFDAAPTVSPFEELNQLIESVENILEEARRFNSPLQLVSDLANGVNQISDLENPQIHNSGLADRINALVSLFDL